MHSIICCIFHNKLSFIDTDAYIIEENENKYLIFALTENNKKMLEMYKKLWNEVKNKLNAILLNQLNMKKDPMKIILDSYDDNLPYIKYYGSLI